MPSLDKVRNLAIIAHIDHGKTTLIDSIFRSTKAFRENKQMVVLRAAVASDVAAQLV